MKLEDIARLAGVSRTTASYVINGKAKKYRVSEKTVEKVMAVVNKYNYHPNPVAAGLRAGKTNSIGLIIPDLENISYTKIANYLERNARKVGYQLLISCSEDNPEIEKACITHLKQRQVDAIVLSSSFINDYHFYQDWDNETIPLIALDRPLDQEKFRSILGIDKYDAKTLTKAFNEYAKDDVIYLGALPELSISRLRKEGFDDEIKSELMSNTTYLYAEDYSRLAANEIVSKWLTEKPIPTSIFATSFALLQGALDAILVKQGFLPENLVIATFGDNELLDFLPCNVITLSQDHKKVAEEVLKTLLDYFSENRVYQPGTTQIQRKLNYRGRLKSTVKFNQSQK